MIGQQEFRVARICKGKVLTGLTWRFDRTRNHPMSLKGFPNSKLDLKGQIGRSATAVHSFEDREEPALAEDILT